LLITRMSITGEVVRDDVSLPSPMEGDQCHLTA
jgi:hypothetical protein